MLDHKTVLTAAQCFFGDEDCCTPKNSFDENCQAELFSNHDTVDRRHRAICDGKDFATAADVFVTTGATTLYKNVIDISGCSPFNITPTVEMPCGQDPNIQVNIRKHLT